MVVVDELNGPTQFVDGPNGWLVVAEINGGEDEQQGRVLAVNLKTKERRVLLGRLDKPTGVAWHDGWLWVQESRQLVRAAWPDATSDVGPKQVLEGDLPSNGRSEGTLTVTPKGGIIYELSGEKIGFTPLPGSGELRLYDPALGKSRLLATGLKNAYAHAFAPNGDLVITEIGDNITTKPLEELNVLTKRELGGAVNEAPVDFGWPRCNPLAPGEKAAGEKAAVPCAATRQPLHTFVPASTPTGIAFPVTTSGASSTGLDPATALVAFFVTGEIWAVPTNPDRASAAQQPVVRFNGLEGPHTIAIRQDGAVWVSEHLAGRIVAYR